MIAIFASKMAGVFMFSTSTISLATNILPRWMAVLGYALALFLLLSLGTIEWVPMVFPVWVGVVSIHVLIESYRRKAGE